MSWYRGCRGEVKLLLLLLLCVVVVCCCCVVVVLLLCVVVVSCRVVGVMIVGDVETSKPMLYDEEDWRKSSWRKIFWNARKLATGHSLPPKLNQKPQANIKMIVKAGDNIKYLFHLDCSVAIEARVLEIRDGEVFLDTNPEKRLQCGTLGDRIHVVGGEVMVYRDVDQCTFLEGNCRVSG